MYSAQVKVYAYIILHDLQVVKRAHELIHKAEYLNDKQIEDSKESTTLLESYGEKLAFAAFAAYEAIRTLGGANDE